MSGRKFKADVNSAAAKVAQGLVPGVTHIQGNADGEAVVIYSRADTTGQHQISIRVLAQDILGYPNDNGFILFTDTEDAPAEVMKALEEVQDFLFGTDIYEMLGILSTKLGSALSASSMARSGQEDNSDLLEEDEDKETSDDELIYDFDEHDFAQWNDDTTPRLASWEGRQLHQLMWTADKNTLLRLKQDARMLKEAGYRVGFLDGLGSHGIGILSISIRVNKLDLSDEALGAWGIPDTDYVVLLLRYEQYVSLETILEQAAVRTRVQYRIGLCRRYKPSTLEARNAFLKTAKVRPDAPDRREEFRSMHISTSLNNFMNESLVSLLKLRCLYKTAWDDANNILLGRTGLSSSDEMDFECQAPAYDKILETDDHFIGKDHLVESEGKAGQGRSFPLIAMQFAMRYFTRCTKYCLRCHRRMEEGFAALRPYVCSNPLCLFQYMSMGLGPDLAHEIVTQPSVVDLLVSLCYASLKLQSAGLYHPTQLATHTHKFFIREFPTGLELRVPNLFDSFSSRLTPASEGQGVVRHQPQTLVVSAQAPPQTFSATIPQQQTWTAPVVARTIGGLTPVVQGSQSSHLAQNVPAVNEPGQVQPGTNTPVLKSPICGRIEYPKISAVILDSWDDLCRLAPDQRVSLRNIHPVHGVSSAAQAFVSEAIVTSVFQQTKTVELRILCPTQNAGQDNDPSRTAVAAGSNQGQSYSKLIPTVSARTSLVALIPYDVDFDTLSDSDKCAAMRQLLNTLPRISDLREYLLSQPGAELVRHESVSPASHALLRWIVSSNRSYIHKVSNGTVEGSTQEAECIGNMDGWVQFRFSQGSPDKEMRFRHELQQVAQRKDLSQYPTLFAWHGSNVVNWHSILRNGLDFKDIRAGRAFGHGVYFSPVFTTSIGYASATSDVWPNSELQVRTVMSMNEIINAPDEFVSNTPHYVVSQPDWHQCRYLFVLAKTSQDPHINFVSVPPSLQPQPAPPGVPMLPQAPGHEIIGPRHQTLHLPVASMPTRVRVFGQSVPTTGRATRILDEDSEDSDHDDKELLACDDNVTSNKVLGKRTRDSSAESMVARKSTAKRPPTPALDQSLTSFRPGTLDFAILHRLQPPSWATPAATRALSRELKKLQEVQAQTPIHELGWYVDFDRVTNIFQWVVELHSFDAALPLALDMKELGITSIVAEIRFGKDFPLSPPFVRVIRPRFLPFFRGGGGHVTGGGSMCMELLTNTGWSPANSMESVIIQVRMALTNLEPTPARVDQSLGQSYNIEEAINGYIRAANAHNWAIPKDLRETALGGN